MTNTTSGMVTPVSAMFVERTIYKKHEQNKLNKNYFSFSVKHLKRRSTFLTPAGGTVKAAAWSFEERVECRATILNLNPSTAAWKGRGCKTRVQDN